MVQATNCHSLVLLDHSSRGADEQGDLSWGLVFAREPEGRGARVTASSLGFEEVGPDDVVRVCSGSEVLREHCYPSLSHAGWASLVRALSPTR